MKFISAEEFLNQDEKVQKIFIDWWKPEIGDLYFLNFNENICGNVGIKIYCCDSCMNTKLTAEKGIEDCDRIPLFTEGQLREFIEDKTNSKIEVCFYIGGYEIDLYDIENFDEYNDERILIDCFESCGDDLLKALWKVALQIAKENVENE